MAKTACQKSSTPDLSLSSPGIALERAVTEVQQDLLLYSGVHRCTVCIVMVGVVASLIGGKGPSIHWGTNGTRPRTRQPQLHLMAAHSIPDPSGQSESQQNVAPPHKQQPGLQPPERPKGTEQAAEQEQLWWVEKFEAKRKEQQQQQQPSSNNTSSSRGEISGATGQPRGNTADSMQPGRSSVPWPHLALQLLQLFVAVAALILWPASLYRTGLYNGKVWVLFFTYLLFFAGGTVTRMVRFGALASRSKDKQAKSLGTRAAWLLFVAMMPVLHWGCLGSYMKAKAAAAVAAARQGAGAGAAGGGIGSLALYDVIGLSLLAAAVWLNWRAAKHLGKAYDRVVQPEALVTTGPYAWVQHPIYSSYMMLFCGYAMVLHSFGYALLALVVCWVYYKSRAALEAEVLQQAFGEQYQKYQKSTKLFVPFLL